MAQAAITVFNAILKDGMWSLLFPSCGVEDGVMMMMMMLLLGTQQGVVDKMQTREDLYQAIDYYSYEKKLDALFGTEGNGKSKL